MSIGVLFCCNVFMMLIVWQYLRDMLEKDLDKPDWVKYTTCFIWLIGTFCISEFLHIPILNFGVNYVLTFSITCCFRGSLRKKLLCVSLITILSAACDLFAFLLLKGQMEYEVAYSVSYIFTVVLFWLLERVLCVVMKKDISMVVIGTEAISIFSISLCMLGLLFCITKAGVSGVYLNAASFFALISCILIFILYHIVINEFANRVNQELLQKTLEGYKHELEWIKKSELKVEGMRHDLKHHLIELKGLAELGEYDALSQYLDNMYQDLPSAKKYSKSGVYEIDSLINYLLEEEGASLRDVTVKVIIPDEIEVDRYKINVILGNLLQNAITAALDSELKSLSLHMKYFQGILLIELRNSFSKQPVFSGNNLITSKKDAENHGIGLRNVRRLVEQQKGKMDIKIEDSLFYVKVLVYL